MELGQHNPPLPAATLLARLLTVDGVGSTLDADLVRGSAYAVVDTIAALKALTGSALAGTVLVRGYYSAGDAAGPRLYRWVAGSSATDNGGTIIAPTAGGGRFMLVYKDGTLMVTDFGAVGDGETDALAAFNAATAVIATSGGTVIVPPGEWYLSDSWDIQGPRVAVRVDVGARIFTTAATTRGHTMSFTGGGNLGAVSTPTEAFARIYGGGIVEGWQSGANENAVGCVRYDTFVCEDIVVRAGRKGITSQYGVLRNYIRNCVVEAAGYRGISVEDQAAIDSYAFVEGCTVEQSNDSAIIVSARKAHVNDCTVKSAHETSSGPSTGAIHINGATAELEFAGISRCRVLNSGSGDGIAVSGSGSSGSPRVEIDDVSVLAGTGLAVSVFSVASCRIHKVNSANGVKADTITDDADITSCRVTAATADGIFVNAAARAIVRGNNVDGPVNCGVKLDSITVSAVVDSNAVADASSVSGTSAAFLFDQTAISVIFTNNRVTGSTHSYALNQTVQGANLTLSAGNVLASGTAGTYGGWQPLFSSDIIDGVALCKNTGTTGVSITLSSTDAASITSAGGLTLGTAKAIKIGTTQVLGAQGAAVADATDATDAVTKLNTLLARLRTHGIIAT